MRIWIVRPVMMLTSVLMVGGLLSERITAQETLRRPVTTPLISEYGLVYLWLPDTAHSGQSHWRWVLHRTAGHLSPHGVGHAMHTLVEVNSLDALPLKAYLRRLPVGQSITLMWQFKQSALAHQAGLTDLQRLCTCRKIGFHILYFGGV